MTIREATKRAYKTMPEDFYVWNLLVETKMLAGRPFLTDGTILRRLRELREDNPFVDYEANKNGFYTKIKPNERH